MLIELPDLDEGTRLAFEARPQRHWTLHLVQHSHLDIGYTDPQGRVMAESRAYLDSLLELCRDTDDWPEPARFRWAVEGFHSFQDWQANRPRRQVETFLDRVREGRVELTAMPFNLHTETCSTDELHELLRPVTALRDRHGIDITTAMQTDVPGQVVGLPDVLADNGIRYLSVAHNWAGRAVPHLVGGEHLPRLFRWQAPSGNSVLVWRTDTPHGLAYMEGSILGFDESYDHVDDLLPAYLSALARFPYPTRDAGSRASPPSTSPARPTPTRGTCCTCGCSASSRTTVRRAASSPTRCAAGTNSGRTRSCGPPATRTSSRTRRSASATGWRPTAATGPTGGSTGSAPEPSRWPPPGAGRRPSPRRRPWPATPT